MGTRSIHRELGQHHAPLVRPLGEASRRAEPEPASGRASKLWLPTARVVDIGYCGYGEPLGSAGEGHTGFRRDLARPWSRYRDQGGKGVKVNINRFIRKTNSELLGTLHVRLWDMMRQCAPWARNVDHFDRGLSQSRNSPAPTLWSLDDAVAVAPHPADFLPELSCPPDCILTA